LRKALDDGKDLSMLDGVLINEKGPYRYNDTHVPDDGKGSFLSLNLTLRQ